MDETKRMTTEEAIERLKSCLSELHTIERDFDYSPNARKNMEGDIQDDLAALSILTALAGENGRLKEQNFALGIRVKELRDQLDRLTIPSPGD